MKKTLSLREQYLLGKRKEKIKILAIQIAVLILFFGLWELLAQTGAIDSFVTSSPSRMLRTLKLLVRQDLFKHVGITLLECICHSALVVVYPAAGARTVYRRTQFPAQNRSRSHYYHLDGRRLSGNHRHDRADLHYRDHYERVGGIHGMRRG